MHALALFGRLGHARHGAGHLGHQLRGGAVHKLPLGLDEDRNLVHESGLRNVPRVMGVGAGILGKHEAEVRGGAFVGRVAARGVDDRAISARACVNNVSR